MNLEPAIKRSWDKYNAEGVITFKSETLTTKRMEHDGFELFLLHNASRDVYDKMPKNISRPSVQSCPFCDDSNPELARTDDGMFRIIGNRFACLQYQSILVPVQHLEEMTPGFLHESLKFAREHPEFTFLYNSKNAGKTVLHLAWLVNFQEYKTLLNPAYPSFPLTEHKGLAIAKKKLPSYLLMFDFSRDIDLAAKLLFELISFMEHKNFNVFLFRGKVFFIPRENTEVPEGFPGHRFGGLELIGYFIMKSKEALETADPELLLSGIRQISFKKENQEKLEAFLSSLAIN